MQGRVREVRDDDRVAAILNLNQDPYAVDLRSASDYAAGHIPGAISRPAADVIADAAGSFTGVATSATIVLYGAGDASGAEYEAAMALEAAGYVNVYYYSGGIANWIGGGRATE